MRKIELQIDIVRIRAGVCRISSDTSRETAGAVGRTGGQITVANVVAAQIEEQTGKRVVYSIECGCERRSVCVQDRRNSIVDKLLSRAIR